MPVSGCRVCGKLFFAEPLLRYENMPGAAQFLPDADSMGSDKGIDLEVCQCSGCGLVQLSNDPVPYYREVIRAAGVSQEMTDFRRRQFNVFINRYSLVGKKVIEIGCGRGEYLSIMQQFDVGAFGLEQSKDAVKQCVDNGLNVSQGFIQDGKDMLNDAPFDAFYMLNYLEHLPDPNSTLRGIYDNISDNAVGLIEVPDFDTVLRNKIFFDFIPDHLVYFTRRTLDTTLALNGFEIIDCHVVWNCISATVKKRSKMDLTDFHKYQAQLNNEITEYIGRFDHKKVAIWGASHQALAIISLMKLADKIKYVVDSAMFKQGKYTPATHVPIVSPEALDSDPVDAVIVVATGYSDEVAGLIRKKFGAEVRVSILRDNRLEEV